MKVEPNSFILNRFLGSESVSLSPGEMFYSFCGIKEIKPSYLILLGFSFFVRLLFVKDKSCEMRASDISETFYIKYLINLHLLSVPVLDFSCSSNRASYDPSSCIISKFETPFV